MQISDIVKDLIARINNSSELQAVILASIITVIGLGLKRVFAGSRRVWWSKVYLGLFNMKQPDGSNLSVDVVKYTIFNHGSMDVDNLSISFNWQPQHLDIYPHVPWTSTVNPDGRLIITFANLNKQDLIMVSMLTAGGSSPEVTGVRFKGGIAKLINTAPQKVHPKWFAYFLFGLLVLGAVAILVIAIRLGTWAIGWV